MDASKLAPLLLEAAGLHIPDRESALIARSYESLRTKVDGLYLPEVSAEAPAMALVPST